MTHIPTFIADFFPDSDQRAVTHVMHIACAALLDELFDDLEDTSLSLTAAEIGERLALSKLPRMWWSKIRSVHIRYLIVAACELTGRLAAGYGPPASLAEALLYDMVVDLMEPIAAEEGVDLPENWRVLLDEGFLEDTDHRTLQDPALDGIEDSETGRSLGMSSTRFEDLFTRYHDDPNHPYLET